MQGWGRLHLLHDARGNDEINSFAEQEERVATKCCIKVNGSKECIDCMPAPAEVWCSKFSVDFLIKSSIF